MIGISTSSIGAFSEDLGESGGLGSSPVFESVVSSVDLLEEVG